MKLEIEVKRRRMSVTQGVADVYVNGERVIIFGDDIKLIPEGGMFYGEMIGNWASTTPDADFIRGLLWHKYDDIYHYRQRLDPIFEKCTSQDERVLLLQEEQP